MGAASTQSSTTASWYFFFHRVPPTVALLSKHIFTLTLFLSIVAVRSKFALEERSLYIFSIVLSPPCVAICNGILIQQYSMSRTFQKHSI